LRQQYESIVRECEKLQNNDDNDDNDDDDMTLSERAMKRFKAKRILGNRCSVCIIGGAMASQSLKDWMFAAFECVVVDG
jgi:hypothetical protein